MLSRCHLAPRPAPPGSAPPSWLGNHKLTMAETGLINGLAASGTQNPADRLVVPGDPDRSILLNRVAVTNGYTRMPSIASNELDHTNIQLLTDWINQEASVLTTYNAWRIAEFGTDSSPEGEPSADPDRDLANNQDEWLTHTAPLDNSSFIQTSLELSGDDVRINLPGFADRRVTVQRSLNLLDWFRWDAPGNDGIPRTPSVDHTLTAPRTEQQEFFRLSVEAR